MGDDYQNLDKGDLTRKPIPMVGPSQSYIYKYSNYKVLSVFKLKKVKSMF